MDIKTVEKAQLICDQIVELREIISSINEDGLKIEYMTKTQHGKIPQRLIVSDGIADMVKGYLINKKEELEAELEAL